MNCFFFPKEGEDGALFPLGPAPVLIRRAAVREEQWLPVALLKTKYLLLLFTVVAIGFIYFLSKK